MEARDNRILMKNSVRIKVAETGGKQGVGHARHL
jgi:hypothetical protein